jgi:hypothetical protein
MALENLPGSEEDPTFTVIMGDQASLVSDPQLPLMIAFYDPNDPKQQFQILFFDRRDDDQEEIEETFSVRWWAIPKTLDRPDVRVPPDSPDVIRPIPEWVQKFLRPRRSRREEERPPSPRS